MQGERRLRAAERSPRVRSRVAVERPSRKSTDDVTRQADTIPGCAYGPCTPTTECGGGSRHRVSRARRGECICTVYCDDCGRLPQSGRPARSVPTCVFDDVVVNGHSGECELPCDAGERCPDGAACTGGVCRFSSTASGCTEPSCSDAGATSIPASCHAARHRRHSLSQPR